MAQVQLRTTAYYVLNKNRLPLPARTNTHLAAGKPDMLLFFNLIITYSDFSPTLVITTAILSAFQNPRVDIMPIHACRSLIPQSAPRLGPKEEA